MLNVLHCNSNCFSIKGLYFQLSCSLFLDSKNRFVVGLVLVTITKTLYQKIFSYSYQSKIVAFYFSVVMVSSLMF